MHWGFFEIAMVITGLAIIGLSIMLDPPLRDKIGWWASGLVSIAYGVIVAVRDGDTVVGLPSIVVIAPVIATLYLVLVIIASSKAGFEATPHAGGEPALVPASAGMTTVVAARSAEVIRRGATVFGEAALFVAALCVLVLVSWGFAVLVAELFGKPAA